MEVSIAQNHDSFLNLQTVKSKPDTVTEEMLDEDLKEDELSDSEGPPTVPDMEQEEAQPSNVSNKYAYRNFNAFFYWTLNLLVYIMLNV